MRGVISLLAALVAVHGGVSDVLNKAEKGAGFGESGGRFAADIGLESLEHLALRTNIHYLAKYEIQPR